MAKGGRKPTSPAEKDARGNPGRRELVEVPEFDELLQVAPYWLDASGVGIWERVVREIQDKDMLVNLDRDLLGSYCQHISNGIAAQLVINEKGLTDENGKRRPEVLIMRDSFEKARHILSELGLTPSERFRTPGTRDKKAKEKELSAKYGIST